MLQTGVFVQACGSLSPSRGSRSHPKIPLRIAYYASRHSSRERPTSLTKTGTPRKLEHLQTTKHDSAETTVTHISLVCSSIGIRENVTAEVQVEENMLVEQLARARLASDYALRNYVGSAYRNPVAASVNMVCELFEKLLAFVPHHNTDIVYMLSNKLLHLVCILLTASPS